MSMWCVDLVSKGYGQARLNISIKNEQAVSLEAEEDLRGLHVVPCDNFLIFYFISSPKCLSLSTCSSLPRTMRTSPILKA